MKVHIINPDVLENLYENHGQFARVCYDTPEDMAEKVGRACQQSGHMSGSRCEYIKFLVTGVDRGTAEQCLRHEIGTWEPFEQIDNYAFADISDRMVDVNPAHIVKNMASFRYIDKSGFDYATPIFILMNSRAHEAYDKLMATIQETRAYMEDVLIEDGVSQKHANEAVNMVLPRATLSDFVIGFTPEALIHFCHKRLCTRAQEFIREVAMGMRNEVARYNRRFSDELVPHCEYLLYCPEGNKSCGRAPTKEEARELMYGERKGENER